MPSVLSRKLWAVNHQLEAMTKKWKNSKGPQSRDIVDGSEEHIALTTERDKIVAAMSQNAKNRITARVNSHTTAVVVENADRVIAASRAEADRVIAASRAEADRSADRIIATVAAAAPRRRRTPAVADGGTVVAGSSTDPVAPLVGSMDSDLCQVIIKASKFGRLAHVCNRPRLTYTSFGYSCRYHSQYRHDAQRPHRASSTAASTADAAGAADAAEAADAADDAADQEAADADDAAGAADQEAADADDDAKLDEYAAAEEKARSAKRTGRTAADSEDELLASASAEPEKKRRKEKKSKRNGAPREDTKGYRDIKTYMKPVLSATRSRSPE